MNKLAVEDLDALLKGAADVPPNGTGQMENPRQTGENSSRPPLLRQSIDKVMGAGGAAVAGAAGLVGSLSKIKTTLPLKEVD